MPLSPEMMRLSARGYALIQESGRNTIAQYEQFLREVYAAEQAVMGILAIAHVGVIGRKLALDATAARIPSPHGGGGSS